VTARSMLDCFSRGRTPRTVQIEALARIQQMRSGGWQGSSDPALACVCIRRTFADVLRCGWQRRSLHRDVHPKDR
jgi:hypothetical protein